MVALNLVGLLRSAETGRKLMALDGAREQTLLAGLCRKIYASNVVVTTNFAHKINLL